MCLRLEDVKAAEAIGRWDAVILPLRLGRPLGGAREQERQAAAPGSCVPAGGSETLAFEDTVGGADAPE